MALLTTSSRTTAPSSYRRRLRHVHTRASGAGIAERPGASAPAKTPDKSRRRYRPPSYTVMLHDDDFNVREYVVQVLLKVVPVLTVDVAVSVMTEADRSGMAAVITCAQEEAEEYCTGLRSNGLTSTIEPAGGGGASEG